MKIGITPKHLLGHGGMLDIITAIAFMLPLSKSQHLKNRMFVEGDAA
ncbi:hypothetical protein [Chlorobium ferrooxidans]|nr:hypothetical protein [Chlorobium ferrooxidans]